MWVFGGLMLSPQSWTAAIAPFPSYMGFWKMPSPCHTRHLPWLGSSNWIIFPSWFLLRDPYVLAYEIITTVYSWVVFYHISNQGEMITAQFFQPPLRSDLHVRDAWKWSVSWKMVVNPMGTTWKRNQCCGTISSWWLNQPIWKISIKLEIFPK